MNALLTWVESGKNQHLKTLHKSVVHWMQNGNHKVIVVFYLSTNQHHFQQEFPQDKLHKTIKSFSHHHILFSRRYDDVMGLYLPFLAYTSIQTFKKIS